MESLQHPSEGGACRSFCSRPPGGVALPYASTTIVGGGGGGGGLATVSSAAPGGCIPNPQAYMIQPQPNPAASSENFVRNDGTSVAPERRNDSTTYQGNCRHFAILIIHQFFVHYFGLLLTLTMSVDVSRIFEPVCLFENLYSP